ncbi:hypothetical protein [Burkholderia sp. 3C]
MSEQRTRTAIIDGFDNAPPFDTGAPIELQFAVNLGAVCADAWLDLKGNVRLHDYAAHQAGAFARGMEAAMQDVGDCDTHRVMVGRQAFAAGLMGRVQQHLFAALGIVKNEPRAAH